MDIIDLDDVTIRRLVAHDLSLFVAGSSPVMIEDFPQCPPLHHRPPGNSTCSEYWTEVCGSAAAEARAPARTVELDEVGA